MEYNEAISLPCADAGKVLSLFLCGNSTILMISRDNCEATMSSVRASYGYCCGFAGKSFNKIPTDLAKRGPGQTNRLGTPQLQVFAPQLSLDLHGD